MITDHLWHSIKEEEMAREWQTPLRMSSAGKCQKALAYQYHRFQGEPLSPRSRLVFELGYLIEDWILERLREEPPPGVELYLPEKQEKVGPIMVDGVPIMGHLDGRIVKPFQRILEIKSINTRGFFELSQKGLSYDYKCQQAMYQKATGIPQTLFVFYNKDTSHLTEIPYKADEGLLPQIENRFSNVIRSKPDKLPPREYGPDAKGQLPYQCSYCAYKLLCWPQIRMEIDRHGKPKFFVPMTKNNKPKKEEAVA